MSNDVEIDYEFILHDEDTNRAVLFVVNKHEIWIPRSLLIEHDKDAHTFSIPEWFAIELELV